MPVWITNPLRTCVWPGLRSQVREQGPLSCLFIPVLSLEPSMQLVSGRCLRSEHLWEWKDFHSGDFSQLTMKVSWTARPPCPRPSLPLRCSR